MKLLRCAISGRLWLYLSRSVALGYKGGWFFDRVWFGGPEYRRPKGTLRWWWHAETGWRTVKWL